MSEVLRYKEEVTKAMKLLGQDKRTIFIGQSVVYGGSVLSDTLRYVPKEKLLEFPVAEELQVGLGIGMAMTENFLPILHFPRFDFLLCAVNQIANHLDVMGYLSNNQYRPSLIIRTVVGSQYPLDGGIQHTRDHTKVFKELLQNVAVIKLDKAQMVLPVYKGLLDSGNPAIVIEMAELY
jgi:pyruvate/2-oxoglutarate/acetoin dehydrogenase E1 component